MKETCFISAGQADYSSSDPVQNIATTTTQATFNFKPPNLTATMPKSEHIVFHTKAILLRFAFGTSEWKVRGEGYIYVSLVSGIVGSEIRFK